MPGYSVRCLKGNSYIDCGSAINNGGLTVNINAEGVSSVIPYYNDGNQKSFNSQTINSSGVSGLIATLEEGIFSTGKGNITYTISGTPSTSGSAIFEVNIEGKTCTLTRKPKHSHC